MADLDELKRKRDQLTARIQAAEARQKASAKKEDDRVKVLLGAALANQISRSVGKQSEVLAMMNAFLSRPGERLAVLGEDGRGSVAFKRLVNGGEMQDVPTGVDSALSTGG